MVEAFDGVARARHFIPELRRRAAEIEAARQLPPDIAEALAQAGLYTMLAPAECGGAELAVAGFVATIAELARGDASAAWCAMVASTACVTAAYLEPTLARTLFQRSTKACGVFAPRGQARRAERDGIAGYIVNGRWTWGSAAHSAELVAAGCLLIDEDGQAEKLADGKAEKLADGSVRIQLMLLDRAQVRLLGNWEPIGLAGTGSGEFEVTEAFVPAARSACFALDAPLARPLYRFPVFGLLACGVAAVALGLAQRAIDEFVVLATGKQPQGSVRTLAERGTVQDALARCVAQQRAAAAGLDQAIAAAWRAACKGEAIPAAERRDLRLAAAYAAHAAAAVIDRLHALAGGDSVFASHPLARCLRDVHVATQHRMIGEPIFELTGRMLLGLPASLAQL